MVSYKVKGWGHSPVETLAEVGGLRACSFRATTLTVYSSPGFNPVWLKDVTSLGSWAITPPSLFCRAGVGRGEGRSRESKRGNQWEGNVWDTDCELKMGTTSLPSRLTAEGLGPGMTPSRIKKNATTL